MPQIFRIGPYIVYFWSNENEPLEPVHVHIAEERATSNADKGVDNQYGQGIAQPQFFQNISPNFEQYDSGDRGQQ